MKFISLMEFADFLESATIEQTIDQGGTVAHIGVNAAGVRFLIVNNALGSTLLIESTI